MICIFLLIDCHFLFWAIDCCCHKCNNLPRVYDQSCVLTHSVPTHSVLFLRELHELRLHLRFYAHSSLAALPPVFSSLHNTHIPHYGHPHSYSTLTGPCLHNMHVLHHTSQMSFCLFGPLTVMATQWFRNISLHIVTPLSKLNFFLAVRDPQSLVALTGYPPSSYLVSSGDTLPLQVVFYFFHVINFWNSCNNSLQPLPSSLIWHATINHMFNTCLSLSAFSYC